MRSCWIILKGDNFMENNNLEPEITKNQETKPFKVFQNQTEFESFMAYSEENLKSKIENDIKEKLEKEAKLSAEEKLMEKIKELEDDKKQILIDKNKIKSEKEFVSNNLENYEGILNLVVSEDEQLTTQNTKKLIDFILINSKKISDEKVKNAMKDIKNPENNDIRTQNSNENIAQKLGKKMSQAKQMSAKILNQYIK